MTIAAQAEYFTYLRRAGETRELGGAFAVKTGALSNTENGVVARGNASVADLVAWLADTPASWLDLGGANHDALIAAGARPENDGREMSARLDDLRVRAPADVAVEQADVGEWLDFAVAHGWDERASFEPVYRALVGDRFRLTVARRGAEVVGLASAFYGSRSVLLTQVIVDEAFRRRGVATALASERIERARDLGCTHAVLGPSPEGAKLYAALGFELRQTPLNRWYYLPTARAGEGCPGATRPAP